VFGRFSAGKFLCSLQSAPDSPWAEENSDVSVISADIMVATHCLILL
jgi:hypothetical protein